VDGRRRRLDEMTGDRHVVLVVGAPDSRLVSACQDIGAALVRVVAARPSPGEHRWYTVAVDEDGHLLDWMRRARAGAVLLRPDHVVQDSEPLTRAPHGAGGQLAARIRAWADAVHWAPLAEPTAAVPVAVGRTDGETP
jgi:3-(3-hydroxy-phenyl)propionate hydroxylase